MTMFGQPDGVPAGSAADVEDTGGRREMLHDRVLVDGALDHAVGRTGQPVPLALAVLVVVRSHAVAHRALPMCSLHVPRNSPTVTLIDLWRGVTVARSPSSPVQSRLPLALLSEDC